MSDPFFDTLHLYGLLGEDMFLARLRTRHDDDFGETYELSRDPSDPPFTVATREALVPVLLEDAWGPNTTPERPGWGDYADGTRGQAERLKMPLYPIALVRETRSELINLPLPPMLRVIDTLEAHGADRWRARLGLERDTRYILVFVPYDRPVEAFEAMVGREVCCGRADLRRTVVALDRWPSGPRAPAQPAEGGLVLVCEGTDG